MKNNHNFRILTTSSLFDGHDASINLFRRLYQQAGLEVIHIGHNRSVHQLVQTAIQEDVDAICVSSYQGGHTEYFKYLYDQLKKNNAPHICILGGGGGTILPQEIEELQNYGICRLYHAEDGRKLGLRGVIQDSIEKIKEKAENKNQFLLEQIPNLINKLEAKQPLADVELGKLLTFLEFPESLPKLQTKLSSLISTSKESSPIVIGVTGPGGAGKSSLVDELITRYLYTSEEGRIGVLAFDPIKKKTGGALLGDRIRMNSIYNNRVYLRSIGTRNPSIETDSLILNSLKTMKKAGFDFIIVETTGIGQADASIVELADISLYVMTSEYGASTQLEKIDMIDYADVIALNKFDKIGSEDALDDIQYAYANSRDLKLTTEVRESLPIFSTIASDFNNVGVTKLYEYLIQLLKTKEKNTLDINLKNLQDLSSSQIFTIIPPDRSFYLGEIAKTIKAYKKETQEKGLLASKLEKLKWVKKEFPKENFIDNELKNVEKELGSKHLDLIEQFFNLQKIYKKEYLEYSIRNKKHKIALSTESLSELPISKISFPKINNWGEIFTFMRQENLPGYFPYTAGVFQMKNEKEDPKRQFAGEGSPERTNKRFHYLSKNDSAKRLSTAFDSVTLYGKDPEEQPDIYGKIGNSGVSIATLEDMKALYKGFDLTDPLTSISLTINGPAPIILAMLFNAAIDFEIEKEKGRKREDLTETEYQNIKEQVLKVVRGTVQADILKEEQAQNTCIFSSKFSLKMMGDIQEYFIKNQVQNFYSVSISGYHIAEAGANPISQVAFTLANGFTYVEYYLSRGMSIDDFAPNLSFFFSSGLDPEYAVIGRVARRIWAIALRERYGANDRSCKLKYHIQTSGRSLHAQEIAFNDIRTTLQALMAIYDNCNSLHTNAYDEAITTPTEESVRRAMAIQLILTKEYGVAKCQNAMQGSYFYQELTELVEEAILSEFEAISRRGGVLGSMEKQYQRHRIQTESMKYELLKSNGQLPIIGVNTYNSENEEINYDQIEVIRATTEEKNNQINRTKQFILQDKNQDSLEKLRQTVLSGNNTFEELIETVKYASLGQITSLLYECGGEYRRSM